MLGADAAPRKRATRYGAADITKVIETLVSAGCEIGLHGIDAWRDARRASEELEEIRRISGKKDIGVRMHWLYAEALTPETLENAGADYDSGAGYNEAIGYRCGTTQVLNHCKLPGYWSCRFMSWTQPCSFPATLLSPPRKPANESRRLSIMRFGSGAA